MIFAVLGGDGRSVRLVHLLRADGHTVRHFGLERALTGGEADAEEALRGADAVILPLPAEKGELLNAPFAAEPVELMEALRTARPGTPVCAGKAGEVTRTACGALGLPLRDYFLSERFTRRNAELTADAAVDMLEKRCALPEKRVLISGFGRIGKALARRLRARGAAVTVAARSEQARAAAEQMDCRAVTLPDAPAAYDFVVNTVPTVIFGAEEIAAFGAAELIELASPPYGFDLAAAKAAGKTVTVASGLPGKYFPEAAAAAVRDAIYEILEE